MFQIIPEEQYPIVQKLLETRLPKSAQLYNALNILRTGRLPSSISETFYAFNGKIQGSESVDVNNLFIVAVQLRKTASSVIMSTPIIPSSEMLQALEELVDWKKSVCFCAVDILYSKFIADLASKHGPVQPDGCDFMTMSISDTKTLQLKVTEPSVVVKELSPLDAEQVTKRWDFADENTQPLMEEMIRDVGSAGVFVEDKLVSMVVIFAIGSVNALYTEDDFRGKGYGKLTMQKVCQIAGERGLVPNVQVVLGNTPSKKLMESVGLSYSHNIEWVFYSPS